MAHRCTQVCLKLCSSVYTVLISALTAVCIMLVCMLVPHIKVRMANSMASADALDLAKSLDVAKSIGHFPSRSVALDPQALCLQRPRC